jgi:hypothetical protein
MFIQMLDVSQTVVGDSARRLWVVDDQATVFVT